MIIKSLIAATTFIASGYLLASERSGDHDAAAGDAVTTGIVEINDFDDRGDLDDWRVVLDGVMGGRSSGEMVRTTGGALRFTGDLSLENNGGFSAVRSPARDLGLVDADGFLIRVRGDGRTYRFDALLRAADESPGDVYRSNVERWRLVREFVTERDRWVTLALPLSEFSNPTMYGFEMPAAPETDPALINRIGFMLADKRPGAFALEVDWVGTYRGDVSEAVALAEAEAAESPDGGEGVAATGDERARRLSSLASKLDGGDDASSAAAADAGDVLSVEAYLVAAIERGVPLFNNSQPAACAAVYETAAIAVLAWGADQMSDDELRMLRRTLATLPRDATERAWALREAFDAILSASATSHH